MYVDDLKASPGSYDALGLSVRPAITSVAITSAAKLTRTGLAMRMVFEDGRAAGQAEASS